MTACRHRVPSTTRRPVRRALLLLVSVALLIPTLVLPAAAIPTSAPPESADVKNAVLVNLENNLTLYESANTESAIFPAATVKIMTGLLACRALEERQNETVTVTDSMLSTVPPGSRIMNPPLKSGEALTVKDLLYAAICGGYNDATCVLATLVSGSYPAFIADMNAEAERLGMEQTYYTNPTGIHDQSMVTSAQDVATLAREAYESKLYMEISSAQTYSIPATSQTGERAFTNRNYLITGAYRNGYCQGMCAGMTEEGGWCVVTVYKKNGVENLCVVMGGKDDKAAYEYVNSLLSWANGAYTYHTVAEAGKVLETAPVGMTGVSKSKAELVPVKDLTVYLPKGVDFEDHLTITTHLDDGELKAPLKAGDVVGTVTVSYDGRVVGRADLTVTEDFKSNGFLTVLMGFRDYLLSRAFLIALAVFVVLLLIYLRMITGPGGRYGIRAVRRRIKFVKRKYN